MLRTPGKKDADSQSSGGSPRSAEEAGASLPSVRRSIGEWEAGKSEPKAKIPAIPKLGASQPITQKTTGSLGTRRASADAAGPSSKPDTKYPNLTAEARACLNKAKLHLGNSRNLKTEIKTEVLGAINRLYEIVKESEKTRLSVATPATASQMDQTYLLTPTGDQRTPMPTTDVPTELMKQLMVNLQQHNQALEECQQHTRALSEHLKQTPRFVAGQGPTFAEMAAAPRQSLQKPLHSVVVSSADENDTSEGVIGKLRVAVNARSEGTRVERLRKARDQKVIVGFSTKEEMEAVKERIRKSGGLRVEEVQNKDPLIILKDVLSCHTDGEITEALLTQNTHLLGDVAVADRRLVVKYRRRTRNPHMGHIILQVSPTIWQRLTAAGRAHVDLQRVQVADQSPLVQCSICLGYGHGRKFCRETIPLCSHCGDPHLKADCPAFATGIAPQCRNCQVAKTGKSDHSAFDSSCPVRMKWDSLARSSVAYC